MTSFRKTALVGGILYLLTFIGSIAAAFLVAPVLDDPTYITGAGADSRSPSAPCSSSSTSSAASAAGSPCSRS